jgi:hypothetical protein
MLGVPLKADTFLPRRFQHVKQPFVAQLRQLRGCVFHFGVLDSPRQHFCLRRAFLLTEKRLEDEIQDVFDGHEPQKPPQQTRGLQGMVEYFVEQQMF